jgi:hypothetical protein
VLAGIGAADGETVRVVSSTGTIRLTATADAALPVGTAFVPWNLPGAPAGDLVDSAAVVTEVRVESLDDQGGGSAAG